jgi:anthranilate synthase component 1
MNVMSTEQLAQYQNQGYNRIPLVREVLADLDTPLSTYLKLARAPYSYLLESVHGGEKWGRYSVIGLPCRSIIKVKRLPKASTTAEYGTADRTQIVIEEAGQVVEKVETSDPLSWIAAFQARFKALSVPHLPRFTGGLVGYFGYDTVRFIEPRLNESVNNDPLDLPDMVLMVSEEIVVFDNLRGKLYVVIHTDPARSDAHARTERRLDELTTKLRQATPSYPSSHHMHTVQESDFVSGFTREGFEQAVARAKDYIVEGDIMQVVLSQRLSVPFAAAPLDLYRALRSLNPSPYMYYLDLGDFHIVGSSPEILVHLEDGMVTVRPIAGTRPRGRTEQQDRALEDELLADPKERAEHLMLIDLGRNDVGRVAEIGSVRLTEQMTIERYSHVMHIVSNVIGKLSAGLRATDVLRATFPAGTVTGAPKIRAMEIIDELEPVKRGVYAGAVGYIGWGGTMDTAIAIRTAVIKDGILHIQVGAGIVADSVPAREWEETMNKGRAMFRAVAHAEAGLQD